LIPQIDSKRVADKVRCKNVRKRLVREEIAWAIAFAEPDIEREDEDMRLLAQFLIRWPRPALALGTALLVHQERRSAGLHRIVETVVGHGVA
jgi:hypothetical protein